MALRVFRQVKLVPLPVLRQTAALSLHFTPEYTGKPLSEKEKAAENVYIRKLEEEMKLKRAALRMQEQQRTEGAGGETSGPLTDTSSNSGTAR